ncbi:hypothetical protein NDU88_002936 [Pleurodeles waltl]|uniref:Uncharacterized protein n=1 Tax=Pleurodeles waltl TaxID=8319 RepID=A0AAV7TP21_PLEWA|nr:hypothetical protein NDU88_002936 [Pleurodeles waltl]
MSRQLAPWGHAQAAWRYHACHRSTRARQPPDCCLDHRRRREWQLVSQLMSRELNMAASKAQAKQRDAALVAMRERRHTGTRRKMRKLGQRVHKREGQRIKMQMREEMPVDYKRV